MVPLERVARLEQENAAMRAEIARIDSEAALEDTVSTRRPPTSEAAPVVAAIMLVVVLATVLAPLALVIVEYQGRVVP